VKDKYALAYYKEHGTIPITYDEPGFVCLHMPKIEHPGDEINTDYISKKGCGVSTEEYVEILRGRIDKFESATAVERMTGEKTLMDGIFGSTKEAKDDSLRLILMIIGSAIFVKACM
jgi:hypothetical protein